MQDTGAVGKSGCPVRIQVQIWVEYFRFPIRLVIEYKLVAPQENQQLSAKCMIILMLAK